jgi:hypothetical protein
MEKHIFLLCGKLFFYFLLPFMGDKLIFRYKLCKSHGKRKALSKDKTPLGVPNTLCLKI